MGQRPYSIRTRIKTNTKHVMDQLAEVRDHIPLEQGLRLSLLFLMIELTTVRDHIPLEQGLRLCQKC